MGKGIGLFLLIISVIQMYTIVFIDFDISKWRYFFWLIVIGVEFLAALLMTDIIEFRN